VGVAAVARPLVVVLCGPTGVGKSQWALRLAEQWPLSIISVDSAQVFRGLDIGTAKPDKATRERVPHYLVDILDPAAAYSAGEFVRDARAAISDSLAAGRLPVLVGGTMLYFRALLHGIAPLPQASAPLRAELAAWAERDGWEALHRELARVDPLAAARITRMILAYLATEIRQLGAVKQTTFKGVSPSGADIFAVQFDYATVNVEILCDSDGMIESVLPALR